MSKTKNIAIIIMVILLNVILMNFQGVFAADSTQYISISDSSITVNGTNIKEDSSGNVYLSKSMNNGGSSQDAIQANIQVSNVINIKSSGTYEFTGELSDGQISINSNEIKGNVTIVLNNANITCKNAPAIFVYNKETKSNDCTITIKTKNGSANTITGGKLKQSVQNWEKQEEILYYIEKGNDDDGTYYERYKYDGAISSDISLNFEGEGSLTINSTEKEGIETKRDITINSGNYIINSLDDGINACCDGKSVITINDGCVVVNLKEESEEGDGIDSNGSLNINGGKVFAFASEGSEDSGLDSDLGININGGYVVGIGNMADAITEQSKQEHILFQFTEKVSKNTLITIVDENKNPVVAFESDRDYKVLAISTPDLNNEQYLVYEGGNIEGTKENGLYIKITSYQEGTQKEYNSNANKQIGNKDIMLKTNSNIYYYVLTVLLVILVIFIIVTLKLKKKGEFEMKGKILTLIIGIIIGAILATTGFIIYNKVNTNPMVDRGKMRGGQMQKNGERPEMPEGQIPGGENFKGEKLEKETSSNT